VAHLMPVIQLIRTIKDAVVVGESLQ
jgi:hypothetical protein